MEMNAMEPWSQRIAEAFKDEKPFLSFSLIYIPVVKENFSSAAQQYDRVIEAIKKGCIYTRISKVYTPSRKLFCYELNECVEEGDHGEDGGFGAEPDTWIIAYLDLEGNFMTPFCLPDEPEYKEFYTRIMKQMKAGDSTHK